MHDARWIRVLLAVALLQAGLGGIMALTVDGNGDGDGSVATDNTTTSIPSTDPAFGTDDPGEPVGVTTVPAPPPPPVQDTRPHLPPSK